MLLVGNSVQSKRSYVLTKNTLTFWSRLFFRNETRDCRDVERYDPFVNKWTTVAPMIYPRNRLAVGTIDHSIYAVGGLCGQQLHATVERYTPLSDTDVWEEVAPMHIPRTGLAVCTIVQS